MMWPEIVMEVTKVWEIVTSWNLPSSLRQMSHHSAIYPGTPWLKRKAVDRASASNFPSKSPAEREKAREEQTHRHTKPRSLRHHKLRTGSDLGLKSCPPPGESGNTELSLTVPKIPH